MTLSHVMGVHGHSMYIQYPDRIQFEERKGFYMQVRGNSFSKNWFHFAIPTPMVIDDNHLRAHTVWVRFRTSPGASVNTIHVYDGETKIATHDNLTLSPQGSWGTPKFHVPGNPKINWGVGISIGVGFNDSANLPDNALLFEISSVGCNFSTQFYDEAVSDINRMDPTL